MIAEKDFDKALFVGEIKEELKYLGMKLSELAIRSKIPKERINTLINTNKSSFKPDEVKAIEKILGL